MQCWIMKRHEPWNIDHFYTTQAIEQIQALKYKDCMTCSNINTAATWTLMWESLYEKAEITLIQFQHFSLEFIFIK